MKPELYTQEYGDELFTLSIECVGCFSVIENIDFSVEAKESRSIADLIKIVVKETRTRYNNLMIPDVYSIEESGSEGMIDWTNILQKLYVSDQNWFDEDGKPVTCKTLLEEVCKILGWTATDWGGRLCLVDYDNTGGQYYSIAVIDGDVSAFAVKSGTSVHVIQDIGYNGDNHTLDIIGGYNKVKIVCSNYPVGDALSDTDMSSDDFLTVKDERAYQSETGGYKVTHHRIYRPDRDNYKMYAYRMGDEPDSVTELTAEDEKSIIDESGNWMPWTLTGAIPHEYDDYNEDSSGNADITDYEYEEEILIPVRRNTSTSTAVFTSSNRIPIIRIKGVTAAYFKGAFSIDSSLLLYAYGGTINTFDFHFSLRIGTSYYHGKSNGDCYWDENPEQDTEYDNNIDFHLGSGTSYEGPYDIVSSRRLGDGLDGVKGHICRLPDEGVLFGDMELIIYAPAVTFDIGGMYPSKFALKGFSFSYTNYTDSDSVNEEETDRVYENAVNGGYINEAEEIDLMLSTYNGDGACYSKLIKKSSGVMSFLTNDLYCRHVEAYVRLEEFLIRRIINQYVSTRLKITQIVNMKSVKTIDEIFDESLEDKKFVLIGSEIDYVNDEMKMIMLEKND